MNRIVGMLSSLILVSSVNASQVEKNPWDDQPTPKVVYTQYLTYTGQNVIGDLVHNEAEPETKLAPKELSERLDVVAAHSGPFYPLKAIGVKVYCSRLVVQNLNFSCITFWFQDYIIHRNLCVGKISRTIGEEASVAYRIIVPSLFSNVPWTAGAMELNEVLIEGYVADFSKESIVFILNKNREETPIEVYFKNCKGLVVVKGIDSDNKIFQSSESPDLNFLYLDEYKRENGVGGSE